MLSSLICWVSGAGDRGSVVGGGDCWDDGVEQVSQVQSLFLRYCAAFKSTENFVCTHPEICHSESQLGAHQTST